MKATKKPRTCVTKAAVRKHTHKHAFAISIFIHFLLPFNEK